jgi:hypothetical protein
MPAQLGHGCGELGHSSFVYPQSHTLLEDSRFAIQRALIQADTWEFGVRFKSSGCVSSPKPTDDLIQIGVSIFGMQYL